MKVVVTREMLVAKGACAAQLLAFDQAFPRGRVTVTPARAYRFRHVFYFSWMAGSFLDKPKREEYFKRVTVIRDGKWESYRARLAVIWAIAYTEKMSCR